MDYSIFNSMRRFVIVDTSNLLFHCAHGTLFWYSKMFDMSQYNGNIADIEWDQNPEFVAHFKKKFIRELNEVTRRMSCDFSQIIFAKDCKSSDVWRLQHFSTYKACRREEQDISKPRFRTLFNYFYRYILPEIQEHHGNLIIGHPIAEADDIIAAVVKYLNSIGITDPVYIISTDKDLFQLVSENVKVINQISEKVYSIDNIDVEKHIFMKIILGDKGDDVPQLKDGVGIKTAEKMWKNIDAFFESLKQDPELEQKFELNHLLMSLDRIPEEICESVNEQMQQYLIDDGICNSTKDL